MTAMAGGAAADEVGRTPDSLRNARRAEDLALVLGAAALLLPIAGLARYAVLLDGAEGMDRQAVLVGAASESFLIGPAIVVGALALWLAASGVVGHRCRPIGRPLLAAAGVLMGVSFTVMAGQVLARVGFFAVPEAPTAAMGNPPTLALFALAAVHVPPCFAAAWIAVRRPSPQESTSDDR